ncbi:hypothetical protein FT663_02328 [Candidozyma haemuli var. vulneris]|uniref:Phosphatidylserine decarboxylase proenzyme 2 n=1 Tax=Candidozyma haemuli TaxID=45357 RepID=A0A2V1ASI1_9ASCO|nr:phosphatidylserine decarboxylase [[Candida] haemuloni]KAF3992401.1 hypothetical protein FT663_02328 [[Candida] haemuloni var. vulneris]PVH20745.1 phosphatidylserine decarboxylase [[Candida] haemuloni]
MILRRKSKHSPGLKLKVNAYRAADLCLPETYKGKSINAALLVQLNNFKKRSRRKLNTSHPSWDDEFYIPLKSGDCSQLLTLSVWSKSARSKTYLGEVRLLLSEIFDDSESFTTSPKWYKLFSSRHEHSFVTGSLLLSFEVLLKDGDKVSEAFVKDSNTPGPSLRVTPPTSHNLAAGLPSTPPRSATPLSEDFSTLDVSDTEKSRPTDISVAFRAWLDSLMYQDLSSAVANPDEQSFYIDVNGQMSDLAFTDASEAESMESPRKPKRSTSDSSPRQFLQHSQSQQLFDDLHKSGSHLKVIDDDVEDSASMSEASSATSIGSMYASDGGGLYSDAGVSGSDAPKKRRFRKKRVASNYKLQNRNVKGVLFVEIISVTDLPPLRNFTRTTFDMDPFVVVTFGKKTFRTSWKRHTLNPIYNERLAFEILEHERNYNVQFCVLDKDHFSFHDKVADVSIPISELMDVAEQEVPENPRPGMSNAGSTNSVPRPAPSSHGSAGSVPRPPFLSNASSKQVPSSMSIERTRSASSLTSSSEANGAGGGNNVMSLAEDANLVTTSRKKKFRKRHYSVSYVDTSLFKTLDLALTLHKEKLAANHSTSIRIRARYLTYENLRRDFWAILLEQFNVNENPEQLDYIELISLLDTLGCDNSDDIVTSFFNKLDRSPWGGDTLTHEEIIDCLEDYLLLESEGQIFEIHKCPICCKKRLSKKQDQDIITHVAICASKDWSIVSKLLNSSFVTPQAASKRWFTKVLIKLTYGKYGLGSNSANILVQDRSTGIIMEEKMNVSVRLGIRLLYKGLDKAKTRRIRNLLRKMSVKQGIKFDSPHSRADINSFIKFHKLDLSECLIQDPTKFETFNDFFYRKLRAEARPVEASEEDRIAVSPADCRCTTFVTVDSATELWIKGRNFSVAKLFNGNFNGLEDTDLYSSGKCSIGIFRLAPQDYHRFHSPVSGTIGPIKYIEGEYYTVNPMAIRSDLDVYGENVRVIVPIQTEQFGTVVMVAIGAMMVGSTILTVEEGQKVSRGDEVGYFKFGGSTVLLLFQNSMFDFDQDLVDNSSSCVETLVRVGQSIGHSPDVEEYKRERIDFSKQPKDIKLHIIRAITGGDLNNLEELGSWESQNIKITDEDVRELMREEDLEDDLEGDLEGSDEEGSLDEA